MRLRVVVISSVGLIVSALACVDLFHSTDTKSACDLDANAPGCVEAGPPDLCDAGDAQANALHACAWLSACEHPIGRNLTGVCMVDAVLAYDCPANPGRPAQGKAKAFWQCMLGVKTCSDVNKCVFPDTAGPCANGGFIGCSQAGGKNVDTRYDCVIGTLDSGALTPGENCAMAGQTCDALSPDASNNSALCVGPARRLCTASGCSDAGLSICDDAGIDHGYDCRNVGAQKCDITGPSPACDPVNTSGTCAPSGDILCTPGNIRAQGCVTGISESVDCTAISGAGTCVPIEAGAPGTLPSDACYVADGGCDADICDEAGALVACVRGRSLPVACATLGLSSCDYVTTEEGKLPTCTHP